MNTTKVNLKKLESSIKINHSPVSTSTKENNKYMFK